MMAELRNLVRLADGRIDCEAEHPQFGWIPYTASETDIDATGRAIFAVAYEMLDAPKKRRRAK